MFTTQPSPRCRLLITAPDSTSYNLWSSQATPAFLKWSLGNVNDIILLHLRCGYPYELPFSFADYEAKGLAEDLEAVGFTTRVIPE